MTPCECGFYDRDRPHSAVGGGNCDFVLMDNTTMTLTDKQRHILRHSLGLTSPNRREYRNHFCTGPGSKDYSDCMALVESGHMILKAQVDVALEKLKSPAPPTDAEEVV